MYVCIRTVPYQVNNLVHDYVRGRHCIATRQLAAWSMGHGMHERGPGYVRRHQPAASTVPGGIILDSRATGACQVQFCSVLAVLLYPDDGSVPCIVTLCSFMSPGRTVWFFCNSNAHAPKDHALPRMHVTAKHLGSMHGSKFFLLRESYIYSFFFLRGENPIQLLLY
jgi:hypothetical protein